MNKPVLLLIRLFIATLVVAAIGCFTSNTTQQNYHSALRTFRMLAANHTMPTMAPPNAGGPGQNGIPFPQGFALDAQFVTAPEVAYTSFEGLQERFAALFGGN